MSGLFSSRKAAVLGLLVATASLGSARADESWDVRFRREAPIAWAELDRADRKIDARTPITIEGTLVENLNSVQPQRIRYARSRDRVLLETTYGGFKGPQAFCMVGKEGFALEAQQGQSNYAVRFVGKDTKSAVSSRISSKMPETVLRVLMTQGRSLTPGDHPKGRFEETFNNPRNHIVAVEPVARDKATLIRVKYTYEDDGGVGTEELLLDPDHHWLALSQLDQPPNKLDTLMTFEYGVDESGHPTLKHYDMKHKFIDGVGNIGEAWQKWEFTKFSFEPIPDVAFTMAAFHMPSFDTPSTSMLATARNYWLLLLSLAFAMVAVLMRSWRWRRPPPSAGQPKRTYA